MLRRPARWAGTVAVLVTVALVALLTAGGIQIPTTTHVTPVSPAEDPCRTPVPERAVGIAPGSDWKADPRAPQDMREMSALGVRWLRLGFEWSSIEPQRGQFRWNAVDRVMREAKASCLSILAMVGTTPAWARRARCQNLWCPPEDPAEFGRFVARVAKRYRTSAIRAWEVWNEENHAAFFRPTPDAARYGRLLVAATSAIRRFDPGTTILSGGLAPSRGDDQRHRAPDRFLAEVYATGAMQGVDSVAYHPYSYPNLPSVRTGNNGFIDQVTKVRQVMVDRGNGRQRIWLTEFGFPTPGGAGGLMAQQEQTVQSGFETWRSLDYAGPLFWFSWRDSDDSGQEARSFGLLRSDGSQKPAFGVFEQELRR
jgi:hypothetical protein